jgi:hypothetical protein
MFGRGLVVVRARRRAVNTLPLLGRVVSALLPFPVATTPSNFVGTLETLGIGDGPRMGEIEVGATWEGSLECSLQSGVDRN